MFSHYMLPQVTDVLFFLWLSNIHIHHILFTYLLMDSSVDLLSWHCAWPTTDTGLQVFRTSLDKYSVTGLLKCMLSVLLAP